MASDNNEIIGTLFYAITLIKEANSDNEEAKYIEGASLLQKVILEDKDCGDAYFHLGYLYENGSYNYFLISILFQINQGLGVIPDLKIAA